MLIQKLRIYNFVNNIVYNYDININNKKFFLIHFVCMMIDSGHLYIRTIYIQNFYIEDI